MPSHSLHAALRSAVALALTATLVAPCVAVAAGAAKSALKPSAGRVDQAALVLDRFTFGARPGELQQVRTMGANAFIIMPSLTSSLASRSPTTSVP